MRSRSDRIKKLEHRNRELSQQNEVFGAQVLKVRELEQQIKRLQAENATLRQQVGLSSPTTPTVLNQSSVEAELEKLGVQLNSTIARALREAPPDAVTAAMAALQEALLAGRVENPSGFFYGAVTAAWRPNEVFEQKAQQELFSEWWKIAQPLGLVSAATQIDGVQHVLTAEQQWVPFDEAVKQFSLSSLYQEP